MKMVAKVAGAFWASAALGKLIGQDFSDGVTSVALQQGGMGLILTTHPDCPADGGDVLPGHAGQLHGVLADWWRRRRYRARPAGAVAGLDGWRGRVLYAAEAG